MIKIICSPIFIPLFNLFKKYFKDDFVSIIASDYNLD